MISTWTPKEALYHATCATGCIAKHDHPAGEQDALVLDNCGACALEGRKVGDDHEPRVEGPNYSGWARMYVEAKRPIPLMWRGAFARELASDNQAYADALRKSIMTFGVLGSVEYVVFGCACERGSACDKTHDPAKCPCLQCVRATLKAGGS
jgi:hypothetical protein